MANFQGLWKQVDFVNAEEFIKATGVSEDVAAKCLKMLYKYDIKIDGKKWTLSIESITEPNRKFKVEFTIGVPMEARDLFGRMVETVPIVENDNLVKETCTEPNDFLTAIIREVKGDRMINTFIHNGVSMYTSYIRE